MSQLTPPVGPSDHILASPDAAVMLVEYGDYQCPFCRRAHEVVQEVRAQLRGDVGFVFRNFPLTQVHPYALQAAEAAEAASAQGSFWQMHDLLFDQQEMLNYPSLLEYAHALNLDVARFARELEDHVHIPKVKADFRAGVRSGVNGTPTFFINAERFDEAWDPQTLASALRYAIASKQRRAGGDDALHRR